jgi:sugar O-acyltransferase (sialic acid O-acetyltransferase NeuD family)
MKNLLIIGARGYGREIYNLATQCTEYKKDWIIKGFLDDKFDALDSFNYPVGIISDVENYEICNDDLFICALGDVQAKKTYTEFILSKGGQFTTLIHPTTIIHQNVKMGTGIIIFSNCGISNEVTVGDFVTFQSLATIGHDTIIGNWCHINAFCFLGGYVEIGDEVTLHTRATILPRVKVGKSAVIGAGSVVIKNVKAGTTVFGNPAKELKF